MQASAKLASYLLPGFILLGIAIDPFPIGWRPIFLNELAPASMPGQHGGDSIKMALLDFVSDYRDLSIAIAIAIPIAIAMNCGVDLFLHCPKGAG